VWAPNAVADSCLQFIGPKHLLLNFFNAILNGIVLNSLVKVDIWAVGTLQSLEPKYGTVYLSTYDFSLGHCVHSDIN